MKEPHTYSTGTCVTAGELRALGMDVDETIPDCGWVPRVSIRYETEPPPLEAVSEEDRKNRILSAVTIAVHFDEPFRWISIKGTVKV